MSRILFSILAVGLSACGPNDKDGPCEVDDRDGYPGGSYGVEVGDTIEDLELLTIDDEPLAFGDIRTSGANRLLFLNTAAHWCTACIEETAAVEDLYQRYQDRCLYVMTAVFEDANFQPANAQVAANWREQYDLTFTVVADPSFLLQDYYDRSLTPMNMLVDLDNMEILRISTGNDPAPIEALIEARL